MGMKAPKRLKGKHSASHVRSPQQELELAKRVKGYVPRGSGSGNEKGDVRVRKVIRIEAKTTKHKSFSVTRKMLDKIETVALAHGELPAFIVEFNDDGKPVGELAIVPTYVLDMIIQA